MESSGRRLGTGAMRRRVVWCGATPRVEVDAGGARTAVPRDLFGGNLEYIHEVSRHETGTCLQTRKPAGASVRTRDLTIPATPPTEST